ncbi:MAG: prolipoprotein diacylglyceryl transferase [Phycisphaeraceae bacterium]
MRSLMLGAWLHDLDPVLLQIGPLSIRWYGLSYLIGFFVAYLLIRRVCRAGISSLQPQNAADLVITVAIGIVLGGRLGYVLLYKPAMLFHFSDSLPYWDVLAINKGGMASHGGMVGGILACIYFAKRHQHNTRHLIDLFAFSAPLGICFGRIANFINGELLGRPCNPDYALAVKFPQELIDAPVSKLLEVYQALPSPGSIVPGLTEWDPWIIIDRIQQGDAIVRKAVEPFLTPRHPSQLYAAILEGLVVFAVLLWVYRRPRKPGLVAGLFAVVYSIARISDEFFRMPDAHLIEKEFAVFGITRGQWLSVLLFVAGTVLMVYALKKPEPPMGGWMRQNDRSS